MLFSGEKSGQLSRPLGQGHVEHLMKLAKEKVIQWAGGKEKAHTSSIAQHLMPALAVSKNKSGGGLASGC